MKNVSLLILAVILCACNTTSATPVPVSTTATRPSQPSAPTQPVAQPTSASGTALNVKDIKQTTQANQVVKTASISTAQNIGIGDLDLSYPDSMTIGESRNVSLRLSASQQLASTTKVPAKNPQSNAATFVYKFSGNVDLYPLMNAEIRGNGFEINPKGRVQQIVDADKPAVWSWTITPQVSGKQELVLNISIPAIVNGADSELTKTLQDLSLAIDVKAKPVSLTDQIMQSIANNSGAIVVALIGLFGTILGIVVKMRTDAEGKKRS